MLEQIINQFHAFWANKTLSELINQYWNENNDQVYNILKMRLIHFGVSESDQQVFQKQYNAQLKEAAQNDNDPRAQTLIGLSYLYGLQGSCDYEQAFDSFEKAAEQKNPWALEDLGVMYGRGWGVEKNYSHARDFCQKAVYYGNAQANRVLGILYHEGLGVSSDDQLALEYFQLAKNAGEIRAIHHLGDHYYNRQDYQTAKTYFEESVAQGESLSLKVLGDLYKDGLGVSQDFNKALLCYEACAKLYSNHQSTLPDSTNDTYLLLGNLYRYTVGDSVKAKYYYQQAANLNDTEAREELEILNIADPQSSLENNIKNLKESISKYQINFQTTLRNLSIAQNLIFQQARQEGQLQQLISDLIADPSAWVISIESALSGKYTILLPDLFECACVNSDNFNRLDNDRRAQIENKIISDLKESFPDKDQPIHYLSLGTGGGLQDYIIIMKMVAAGYRNIQISLVDSQLKDYRYKHEFGFYNDPEKGSRHFKLGMSYERYKAIINGEIDDYSANDVECDDSDQLKTLKELPELVRPLGAYVDIQHYPSIPKFSQQSNKPQIITAIDFDDFERKAFDDIVVTHQQLHPQGRMYLSYQTLDITFSAKNCLRFNPQIDHPLFDSISNLSKQNSNKNRELKIATLMPTNYFSILYSLVLPYINNQSNLDRVNLTLVRPQETNFFGASMGADRPNQNIDPQLLAYYLQLFLKNPHTSLEVQFAKGYDNIDELLKQYDSEQDFAVAYGHVIRPEDTIGVEQFIHKIHKKFPMANSYFAVEAYARSQTTLYGKPILKFHAEWAWDQAAQKHLIQEASDDDSRNILTNCYDALKQQSSLNVPIQDTITATNDEDNHENNESKLSATLGQ